MIHQSGILKKVLLVGLVIIILGVSIGFLTSLKNVNNGSFGSSAEPNYGSIPGPSSGNSLGNSLGIGQSISSGTTVMSTVTMAATTMSSTSAGPSTTLVKSNPSASSQTQPAAPSSNTSARSGFIEFFSNVTVQVSSPQFSLNKAMAIAYTYGGYVAYSSYSNLTSFAVLRIPAANYQSALGEVEGLGNLTGFSSNSNDVSVQYTDLNATLQSLLTEQSSLLSLENKSTSLNSTLIIENELQGVNTQINEIQSEILQTRILIDYSTITITLEKAVPPTTPKPLTLKLVATPQSGMEPLAVTFNSVVTGGNGSYIVNYNFGDGSSYQGQTLIHTFTQPGTFNVTVTVTDTSGSVQQAWIIIHVTAPPSGSQFKNFSNYVSGLLIAVVEGIVEVAVVILPIALVVVVVILPFRNRLRTKKTV